MNAEYTAARPASVRLLSGDRVGTERRDRNVLALSTRTLGNSVSRGARIFVSVEPVTMFTFRWHPTRSGRSCDSEAVKGKMVCLLPGCWGRFDQWNLEQRTLSIPPGRSAQGDYTGSLAVDNWDRFVLHLGWPHTTRRSAVERTYRTVCGMCGRLLLCVHGMTMEMVGDGWNVLWDLSASLHRMHA
ncbi:hypothetical protein RRG08_065633 [Elysia crispata]|uniref:Uncharacterized protein n=1 Tax=Elysia crispata TaxID=231223 RepID=A0AAE0YNY4_9GAST|nr:hypothetical protein RRG08_065633 [Elysia crispata]